MRIVEALQARGLVVAMTGDGGAFVQRKLISHSQRRPCTQACSCRGNAYSILPDQDETTHILFLVPSAATITGPRSRASFLFTSHPTATTDCVGGRESPDRKSSHELVMSCFALLSQIRFALLFVEETYLPLSVGGEDKSKAAQRGLDTIGGPLTLPNFAST